jgi:hypothetical protein
MLGTTGTFAADDDNAAPAPDARPHTKVLQDPKEVSDFYTSSQSSGFAPSAFELGYNDYEYDEDANVATNPYAISSFYTQNAPTGRYPIAGFYQQNQPMGRYPISGFYTQDAPKGRYPIAGFYTQNGSRTGRYSRLWTTGNGRYVGGVRVSPQRFRRAVARELCFMAPTVLVPFATFVNDAR